MKENDKEIYILFSSVKGCYNKFFYFPIIREKFLLKLSEFFIFIILISKQTNLSFLTFDNRENFNAQTLFSK